MLELYTTLSRSEVREDEQILEESIDGMDFVAGVLFADAEGRSGTNVTLRLGYYLPGVLQYTAFTACFCLAWEFLGCMGMWGEGGWGSGVRQIEMHTCCVMWPCLIALL